MCSVSYIARTGSRYWQPKQISVPQEVHSGPVKPAKHPRLNRKPEDSCSGCACVCVCVCMCFGCWPVFYLACAQLWNWRQTVMYADAERCACRCCWLVNRAARNTLLSSNFSIKKWFNAWFFFFFLVYKVIFCPNMNQLENLKCGWMIVVLMICTVYLLTTKHHLRKFKCCSSCLLLFPFKWPESDKSS